MKLGVMLAAQALRHPERLAVACGEEALSYRTLDDMTNRLARALLARGLKPGNRVALLLDNSLDVVVAFLGVVKAGGIVVPVSTRLTPSEVSVILSDSDPAALVYQPYHRDLAAEQLDSLPAARRIVTREPHGGELSLDALCAEGEAAPPPPLPNGFDDCIICYTSGTTGRPKGAIITHASLIVTHGLINALDWGLNGDDKFLIVTPLAHRTGIGRLANALCVGASMVVLPRFDPELTISAIESNETTVIGMVPTIARMLLPEIERDPQRVASLRLAIVTGEAFPVEVKQRLLKALPDLQLFSFFASTEAGGVTTLGPGEQFTHAASVGRALPGVEVRILDDAQHELPVGEAGEIVVRAGEPGRYTTMRGYYNREKENAETIRDGWLYTGDVGRFDADGYLYVVDRKKDMIISGGLNIYSKEVETALRQCPGVTDAAVIGVPDPVYGESVAAVIEAASDTALTEADIILHCRNTIASYKKPKHVRIVTAMPRNSMGKVLKYKLREAFADAAPVDTA